MATARDKKTDDKTRSAGGNDESDAQRVAIACSEIQRMGRYPSVASVQDYLKTHLGGGIKTARISPLIKQWEAASKATKRAARASTTAEPPPPSLDDLLELHPDLLPAFEQLASSLSAIMVMRGHQESEARTTAIQAAVEMARNEAAKERDALTKAHADELAEKDSIIEQLRAAEAEQVDALDQIKDANADLTAKLEKANQDHALAASDARTANAKLAEVENKLAGAEARAKAAEGRVTEIENTHGREQERLRGELTAAQQALAGANEARAAATAIVEGLRNDLATERKRNDELRDKIEAGLQRELDASKAAASTGG